jgi:hypothetical protein
VITSGGHCLAMPQVTAWMTNSALTGATGYVYTFLGRSDAGPVQELSLSSVNSPSVTSASTGYTPTGRCVTVVVQDIMKHLICSLRLEGLDITGVGVRHRPQSFIYERLYWRRGQSGRPPSDYRRSFSFLLSGVASGYRFTSPERRLSNVSHLSFDAGSRMESARHGNL